MITKSWSALREDGKGLCKQQWCLQHFWESSYRFSTSSKNYLPPDEAECSFVAPSVPTEIFPPLPIIMEGMRWLNGITDSMDMKLGKLLVVPNSWWYPIRTGKTDVMQSMRLQRWTQLSNRTVITANHHRLSSLLLPLFLFYYFLVVPCHHYQLSFTLSDLLYYSLSLFFFFSQNLFDKFISANFTARINLVIQSVWEFLFNWWKHSSAHRETNHDKMSDTSLLW